MKDLRSYASYRDFLTALYETEREAVPSLSFTKFSERLGFPESSLRMILTGRRNLTVANIHGLARVLKFSARQTAIFESMVLRDQASSKGERQYYCRRLKEESNRHKLEERRVSKSRFVKEWFGPALLIYLRDRKLDVQTLTAPELAELAERLGVSVKNLSETVEWYRENGYLASQADRDVHFTVDKMIKGPHEAKQFIKRSLLEAANRLESDYASGRSLYSVKTFSIDSSQIGSFGADYKELLEKYMQEPREDSHQTVLQVNFAALRMLD